MTDATVFVVDDDAAVRDGLALLLDTAGHRVRLFGSAEAFLGQIEGSAPGCLILDLHLPGMSGQALQSKLIDRRISMPVIFLSAHGDVQTTVRTIKAGAEDFLTKPVEGAVLLARVEEALAHDHQRRERVAREAAVRGVLARLSAREMDVLKLAVDGMANKEIGKALGISHRTVEVHRSRILLKTGTTTLLELVALARTAGVHV